MSQPLACLRPEIIALQTYQVPDARGLIKLDAMENPYTLPDALADEVMADVARLGLNRYPDPALYQALVVRLREVMSVPDAAGMVLGNGSDEIIQMLALAVAKPGACLLTVGPTFVMFRAIAELCGLRYVEVPLTDEFALDMPAMLDALAEHQPALTFLAYPNNPTGNLFATADIMTLVDRASGYVIVDEAYSVFAEHSFMPLAASRDNLVVMRTLSKVGLAGLRLGYLAGPQALTATLDKVRMPYNVNVLTLAVAERLLQHYNVFLGQAEAIKSERTRVMQVLSTLSQVKAFPSSANFILFQVPDAERTFAGLKAAGLLIKAVPKSLARGLRVTIGSPVENNAFLTALRKNL